ncbi:hypothetical protein FA13DRAFT_1731812 [Coprinellus micaceus]|uniref:Uncharacterized protein n=1 Tax=Coprinellus micaceus TaxID=71717 RepID=A0A4Y7TEQ8_COPMI|nr:hypothetical protein FA13DRAFT_1731812 [Coprinellus micaceus]
MILIAFAPCIYRDLSPSGVSYPHSNLKVSALFSVSPESLFPGSSKDGTGLHHRIAHSLPTHPQCSISVCAAHICSVQAHFTDRWLIAST